MYPPIKKTDATESERQQGHATESWSRWRHNQQIKVNRAESSLLKVIKGETRSGQRKPKPVRIGKKFHRAGGWGESK